jgi:hypothetical protein
MIMAENTTPQEITLDTICIPSTDIVARIIEGEIVIVPLVAGIGDLNDELYTLNSTGKAIWDHLHPQRTLGGIVTILTSQFDAPFAELEQDVLGFAEELVRRRMLVIVNP